MEENTSLMMSMVSLANETKVYINSQISYTEDFLVQFKTFKFYCQYKFQNVPSLLKYEGMVMVSLRAIVQNL